MNEVNDRLRLQTLRRYRFIALRYGLSRTAHDGKLFVLVAAVLSALVIAAIGFGFRPIGPLHVAMLTIPVYLAAALMLTLCLIYRIGIIPGGWDWYNDFVRIGLTNSSGEAPFPVQKGVSATDRTQFMIFIGKGFPLETWEHLQTKVESARDIYIVSLIPLTPMKTRMEYIPAGYAMPDQIFWEPQDLSDKDFILRLGQAPWGTAQIDLSTIPHWLVAGATGMGKSVLLRLIVRQCLAKGAAVTIADWKGGLDYPLDLRESCRFVTDEDALLQCLAELVEELEARKKTLTYAGAANLTAYNRQTSSHPMQRRLLVLDETSMILDTTGRTKADKDKIAQILNGLLTLGRLGRAFGLHLLCATQRPDVSSVPGSLKAHLDGRLCGHTADAQSSIVIMDDGAAAKLPAIPGRFLLRDASGIDKIFQVYFCN